MFKLEHPKLRGFLEEHIGIALPSESTVRKKHLPKSYETAIDMIKKDLDGKRLWMSIDETTDVQKRKVANVILGELSSRGSGFAKKLSATARHDLYVVIWVRKAPCKI